MTVDQDRVSAAALAGNAIAADVLDLLLQKGIISLQEARGVLEHALQQIHRQDSGAVAVEATSTIGSLLSGKFSESQ